MSKSYQHLSRDERAAIAIGLEQGLSRRAIARLLNRSPSTISREVRRNGGKRVYHPARAQQRREARRFRQERRLIADPGLWHRVLCWMRKGWSPEQCAGKLKVMYENDPKKRVSHETIYAHIYAYPLPNQLSLQSPVPASAPINVLQHQFLSRHALQPLYASCRAGR
jgi:IS30 family transposase